jgi:hypothetical protein
MGLPPMLPTMADMPNSLFQAIKKTALNGAVWNNN